LFLLFSLFLSHYTSPVLLDSKSLSNGGHFFLIITEAGLFLAWKWINTLEALRGASIVLFGTIPGVSCVVAGNTISPCRWLSISGFFLHEVNLSIITIDWFILISSFGRVIRWLVLTEALFVNSFIENIFLQT